MCKQTKYYLEIEIDKLTNSIVNTNSGDSFSTDVHPLTKTDLKILLKRITGFLTGQMSLSYQTEKFLS